MNDMHPVLAYIIVLLGVLCSWLGGVVLTYALVVWPERARAASREAKLVDERGRSRAALARFLGARFRTRRLWVEGRPSQLPTVRP